MAMQLSSDLMDGLVLALLSKEDLYGYSLTKQVQERFAVSESTMYPVLRRLKKRDWVTLMMNLLKDVTEDITRYLI
ncbi:Transcriptional regulator PadR-like family protein [Weissella hellenica]|uniref:Transcriptional regulator PadR-like family protein n=1 Tax=Weissella hellenica TaxID=46256 RepID=A0ABY0K3N5_WEIHE|nr:hypothetical protein WHE01_13540 [Weissella hellenica]SCC07657.1 Transcriptional regulator PadR-like family protein [Weissella hellenica]